MSVPARPLVAPRPVLAPTIYRPRDPHIRGLTLEYMRLLSHQATRRLVDLAFRDAHSAIDLTYAHGGCWRGPLPPGLALTTSNLDPTADTDLHLNYLATGLDDEAYDLVVFDPVHLADGGKSSIMARRFGTVKSSKQLRAELEAGALEAWRVARVGLIVKVTNHCHGGRWHPQSTWVQNALPMLPYFEMHAYKPRNLESSLWKEARVPRSNGAVWLAFRKDSPVHKSFDALYARQVSRISPPMSVRRCASCDNPLGSERRADAVTCSDRCRQRLRRSASGGR